MALPAITSFHDCADFSKTVQPWIPQVYDLPNQIASSIYNYDIEELRHLYISTNPVISGFAFSLFLFPIFLLLSEINRNYSQVDRVWSILPTVYHAHYATWARLNRLPTQTVDTVLACSVIWTLRLTYNYWRKGGYQIGSEDYRWGLVKKKIGQPAFFLFNVLFISSAQSVLLFLVTTPTYILLLTSRLQPEMTVTDIVITRAFIVLVVLEYFADGQMWDYQQAKKQYQATAKVPAGYTRAEMDRGFCTKGLWKYSRHPNFAAEQAIWLLLYQWTCWLTGEMYNWSGIGVAAYLGVFAASTPLTESISSGKYPEYKAYQERVGRFVPQLFGKGWDEAEMEQFEGKLTQGKKKMSRKP